MGGFGGGGIGPMPEPKDPAPMPDPESPAILEAKKRHLMDAQARAGRVSTILTTPETRPNTNDYSRTTLGGR